MKSIVISGASSGIGKACAELFADSGYLVHAISRTVDKITKHKNILPHRVDLLSKEEISKFTAQIKNVDGIIHAAGIVIRKPFLDINTAEMLCEFQTHVFSTVQLNQELYPLLKESSEASIVYVSSNLALKPIANTSIYSAAKAAQAALVKALAIEWAPIRVNGIYLGITDTPIHQFKSEEEKLATHRLHPLGRMATAEEVAKEIYHLYHSKWTTGAMNLFDGGISLS